MVGFPRTKRVTDPLDDKVKARIIGRDCSETFYCSSGSEHSAHDDFDDFSPSLFDLVHGLVEDDSGERSAGYESDSDRDPSMFGSTEAVSADDVAYRLPLVDNIADPFKVGLAARVSQATDMFSCLNTNKSMFRRNVMAFLRDVGYNAAICKTKWETSGGLTAGKYEFIDVVRSDSSSRITNRYFVDLDFAGEFKIARPTSHYDRLHRSLPPVFIGRGEELRHVIKAVSDEAKRSLKSNGLHLPPWRKNRFMQNKWLGPHRRSTNLIPTNSPTFPSSRRHVSAAKCRSVGFLIVNGPLIVAASTRTR